MVVRPGHHFDLTSAAATSTASRTPNRPKPFLHKNSGSIWFHNGRSFTAASTSDAYTNSHAATGLSTTANTHSLAASTAMVANATLPDGTTDDTATAVADSLITLVPPPTTTMARPTTSLARAPTPPRQRQPPVSSGHGQSQHQATSGSGQTPEWHDRLQQPPEWHDGHQRPQQWHDRPHPAGHTITVHQLSLQELLQRPQRPLLTIESITPKTIAKLNILLAALPRLLPRQRRHLASTMKHGHSQHRHQSGHAAQAQNEQLTASVTNTAATPSLNQPWPQLYAIPTASTQSIGITDAFLHQPWPPTATPTASNLPSGLLNASNTIVNTSNDFLALHTLANVASNLAKYQSGLSSFGCFTIKTNSSYLPSN